MARLRGRGERAQIVEVRFAMAARRREWRVEFALPQGSAAGLIPILREKLGFELARAPLGGPVEAMEVEIVESVPGSGPQRDFFSKKEEEREAWDALVARLSAKLGKEQVFVAFPRDRYLPERAFVRRVVSVPSIGKPVTEVFEEPDRPARVLKRPEPLSKDGRHLRGPDGKRWKALSWEGPERLSGEWWKDAEFEGFNRDYYRVITEGGDQLWVFVNRKTATPSFYLHGYFD
jgi:protein ImuB